MKIFIIILATAFFSVGISYYIFDNQAKKLQEEIYHAADDIYKPYVNIIDYINTINEGIADTLFCSSKLNDIDKDDITNIQIKTKNIQKILTHIINQYNENKEKHKFDKAKENCYWLGENHQIEKGEAHKLRTHLNDYFDGLRYNDSKKEQIEYVRRETESYRPHNKEKVLWEEYYFLENGYLINYQLYKLLIDVLTVQRNELSYYTKKANIKIKEMDISQRQIICKVKELGFSTDLAVFPYNPIIPLGTKYQSDIKLMAVSKEVLKYHTNIGIVDNQVLKIPVYQHIQQQKSQTHIYTLDTKVQGKPISCSNSFTTYTPSLAIKTETSQQLYLHCRHQIQIEANDLVAYKHYFPVFKLNNAYILQQKNNHHLTICPTGKEVRLEVFNKLDSVEVYLDKLSYEAIQPPKPHIQLSIDQQNFTPLHNQVNANSEVKIQIIPNKIFQQQMPEDSHYQIGTVEVYSQNAQNSPQMIQSFQINKNIAYLPLSQLLSKQNKLQHIVIVVKEVYRINFRGEKIKEESFFPQENMFNLRIIKP